MASAPGQARAPAAARTTCSSLQLLELFGSVCIAACWEIWGVFSQRGCAAGRITCAMRGPEAGRMAWDRNRRLRGGACAAVVGWVQLATGTGEGSLVPNVCVIL